MDRWNAREEVLLAVLCFLEARISGDLRPENPYAGDQSDYAADRLDDAVAKYVRLVNG